MEKICMIFFFLWLLLPSAYNQFTCEVITSGLKSGGVIPDYLNFIPNSSTPIKVIRVNFHFMLLEDSHPDAPGNFTPYDDGRGNTNFTGYDFVNDLLYWTNQRLASNNQMTYPLGNSTPVISRKYQFILNGVFFHKDNAKYWYYNPPGVYSSPENTYSENVGKTINIFFQSTGTVSSGGHANLSGNRYVDFTGKWDVYNYCQENGLDWGIWGNTAGLMHETGHNLSLLHTVMTDGGMCCNLCDDYCTDTPTRNYVITHDNVDPCCQNCQWGNPINSNNIMDYSGSDAITPEQLGRVHWTIQNEIQGYQPCYFTTSSINISSFTNNNAYIAETVTVPAGSNIIVDNNRALYINSSEFTINGPFEIKLGAQLVVNNFPKCN